GSITENNECLNENCRGIGFSVRFDNADDLASETMPSCGVHNVWPAVRVWLWVCVRPRLIHNVHTSVHFDRPFAPPGPFFLQSKAISEGASCGLVIAGVIQKGICREFGIGSLMLERVGIRGKHI